MFDYLRDPEEISRRSFATIRQECDFSVLPEDLAEVGLAQESHHHHVEGIGAGAKTDNGHVQYHEHDHGHEHGHHPYPHADHPLGPKTL